MLVREDIEYVDFGSLRAGDVFNDMGAIYMKIDLSYCHYDPQFHKVTSFDAVRINDGEREFFGDNKMVIKLNATLHIGG